MLHSSNKASLLRIMTIGILSFALVGATALSVAPTAAAASPSVKVYAIPTISYQNDGKYQVIAIDTQLEAGNHIDKITLWVDKGKTNERKYEFTADGTVITPGVGLVSVHCEAKMMSDGYAIHKTKDKCRVELDKTKFTIATHQVRGEVQITGLGTFSDTAFFTLKASKASLSDLVNKSFTAPSTAKRGHTYTTVVTEKNEGAIGAGGHWVKVYLSGNAARDSGDTKVGEKYVNYIGKGATRVLSISAKVPNSYALGPEFFVSYVDSENVIGEQNESNNERSQSTTITS